jgi:hypothetical protein
MTNVTKAIAACAGTIALACAVVQPAKAADMPQYPQYGGPPVVQERYVEERRVYQEAPQAYYRPAPPQVYQEYAPPALVPVPEPYYVPQRRVYVEPGYSPYAYAPRPYVAGYGYHRPHYHHHHHNHRHW